MSYFRAAFHQLIDN